MNMSEGHSSDSLAASWPELREELEIFPSTRGPDGAPAWSIHDPVRNLYFHIDWLTYEILRRWRMKSQKEIVQSIHEETALRPSTKAIQQLVDFLQKAELLRHGSPAASDALLTASRKRKTGWLKTLLHSYLFFRIPLWKPDKFLGKTVRYFDWCGSQAFFALTLIAMLAGLFEISRQWEGFRSTLVNLFSWEGALAYGVTLVLIKFLHELGHAYSAKRKNCRVPTMGIAFLVLFPLAYTDVNDVWRLSAKKDKLAVGMAGIKVELFIAAWASLAWSMLPDGSIRTGAFLLASTTWVSTLIINASPFLRFDGYFILMDYLQIPNLHARSFAMSRWKLRELLFREGKPAPEFFPAGRERFLIIFGWLTWAYRLVMFTGIAILIYLTVPKPLGQILAAVELSWFVALPIYGELKTWFTERESLLKSGQWRKRAFVFVLMFMVFVTPWDKRIASQGILKPSQVTQILTPGDARIQSILVSDGDVVTSGDVLVQLENPSLVNEILAAKTRQQALAWQQQRAGLSNELREQSFVLQAEQRKISAELSGLTDLQEKFTLRAAQDGVYRWVTPYVKGGDWLSGGTVIAEVLSPEKWQVDIYLTETELDRISVGDAATFYPEADFPGPMELAVSRIDRDATRVLPDPILSSVYGGGVLVREQNSQLIPEIAVFRVTLSLGQNSLAIKPGKIRGKVTLYGKPRSWVSNYLRAIVSLLRREASF